MIKVERGSSLTSVQKHNADPFQPSQLLSPWESRPNLWYQDLNGDSPRTWWKQLINNTTLLMKIVDQVHDRQPATWCKYTTHKNKTSKKSTTAMHAMVLLLSSLFILSRYLIFFGWWRAGWRVPSLCSLMAAAMLALCGLLFFYFASLYIVCCSFW